MEQIFGGIWLDASTILTAPLDWVLQAQQAQGSEYLGFYLQRFTTSTQYPVVENWFMAAAPGSAFVTAWQREFDAEVVPRGNTGYLQHLQALGLLPAEKTSPRAPEATQPPASLPHDPPSAASATAHHRGY